MFLYLCAVSLLESCHWQGGFPECRVRGKGAQNWSLSLPGLSLDFHIPVLLCFQTAFNPFTHSFTHSFPRLFIPSCPVTSNPEMRPMPGAEARRAYHRIHKGAACAGLTLDSVPRLRKPTCPNQLSRAALQGKPSAA